MIISRQFVKVCVVTSAEEVVELIFVLKLSLFQIFAQMEPSFFCCSRFSSSSFISDLIYENENVKECDVKKTPEPTKHFENNLFWDPAARSYLLCQQDLCLYFRLDRND